MCGIIITRSVCSSFSVIAPFFLFFFYFFIDNDYHCDGERNHVRKNVEVDIEMLYKGIFLIWNINHFIREQFRDVLVTY